MPKDELNDYSGTAGLNTDVGGINIAEGWSPANVNNSIREIMSDIARVIAGTTRATNWYQTDGNISGTLTVGTLIATTFTPANLSTGGTLSVTGASTLTGAVSAGAAITAVGAVTGLTLIPTGATAPTNGMYLAAANTLGLGTNSVERLRLNASGALGIGGATFGTSGQVFTSGGAAAPPTWTTPSTAAGYDPSGTATKPYRVRLPINTAAANVAVQAGTVFVTSGAGGAVTFATAFTAIPVVVVSTGGTPALRVGARWADLTTTGFTAWAWNTSGSFVSDDVDWIAIGPVA